jgi:hypothetical protein
MMETTVNRANMSYLMHNEHTAYNTGNCAVCTLKKIRAFFQSIYMGAVLCRVSFVTGLFFLS